MSELIKLTRECVAYLIPAGDVVTLKKDEPVRITQSLGGSYTLLYHGHLVRIEGKDADAIGKEPEESQTVKDVPVTDESVEKMAWDAMKQCYDPEIPVNIVDLGLVYDCSIQKLSSKKYDISIKMTLTAPGCGMAGHIAGDVKHKVAQIPGVENVEVDIVWEPQWTQNMMSDAAKLQLGMM